MTNYLILYSRKASEAGMNDLKHCPFCGSEAQLLIVPGRVAHWVVKCSKGCCNTCHHISDHDAVEAWNKRTAEERPEIVRRNKS